MGLLGFPSAQHLAHAMMLVHMSGISSPKVTIFTNGELGNDPELQEAVNAAKFTGCVFDSRKVSEVQRASKGQIGLDVCFDNDEKARIGFLVDKPPTIPVGEEMLVQGLGVEVGTDPLGRFIKRVGEPFGETSVKGCFAAGDVGTSIKQVTTAMFQGGCAGAGISQQLCAEAAELALAKVRMVNQKDVEVKNVDATSCVE